MLRPLVALAGLVVLVALTVQVLLHDLDRPWLKRRVVALVRTAADVDIDYGTARVDLLSGADFGGLVVRSPASLQHVAPDLVRVDHLEAHWSLGSLLSGRRPRVGRVTLSGITLTVVVDEHGQTSFDALSRSGSSSGSGPGAALSGEPARLLGVAPAVGSVDVRGVTLVMIRTGHGRPVDRFELRGLALALAASPAAPAEGGWRLDAHLGSPSSPIELSLTHAREDAEPDTARGRLWATFGASSRAVSCAVDLRMIDQTFAATVSADHWLHAEADLRFDAAAGETEVVIDPFEAGDGAATAQASLEIPDRGEPVVRHARGDIDVAQILRWLPAGLVPLTAERARVRWQADSLVLGVAGTLPDRGSLSVDGDLSNVSIDVPPSPIEIGAGALSARARADDDGGLVGRGSAKLDGVRLGDHLAADGIALDVEGRRSKDGVLVGRAGLRFARVDLGAAPELLAREGDVEVHVDGLRPDLKQPLATRGNVMLSARAASVDARSAPARAIVEGLTLRAHTALEGHAPYDVQLEAPMSRVRVVGRDAEVLADAPLRVQVEARDLHPDIARPPATRGVVAFLIDLGDAHASLDVTKGTDAADFAMRATLPSLKLIRPFLPDRYAESAPWDGMALSVRSSGHLEGLGGAEPSVRQTTEVHLERPAFGGIVARSLALKLQSRGTALRHQLDLDLAAQGLTLDGGPPSDDRLKASAALDRRRPSLHFQIASDGRVAANASGALSFDRGRRAVHYDVQGRLARLASLTPLAAKVHGLEAFDLSQLDVGVSARGEVRGVLAAVTGDGTIQLEPAPARTASIDGSADLRVAHFRWARDDTAILAPSLAWHGEMRTTGSRRVLDGRLHAGTLHVEVGSHDVDVDGIEDAQSVSLAGDLTDPDVELTQKLAIRAVGQDLVPGYPLGDLTLALSATRTPDGTVHIASSRLTNGRAASALAIEGNVELGAGRRTLALETSLTQDLARASTIPERFRGRGKLSVQATVDSPDLTRYVVRALVKGEDVDVTLPRSGIDLQAANGEVPVTLALQVSEDGVALERSDEGSPYSMLRFEDQHPLLAHSGFLSIARLETPYVSIAPLVGNLEIERNVVSLRQFEMGVRGGTITGQCGLDWDGPRSTLELHVRASGVQSSHGEPFDGNISVVVSAADHTIEGRAEVLRIGKRHLLDLLDLQDPLHLDPSINRIRSALVFGYPDHLRLVFDHGFASAHLELGGLARFVSIGDLRGIPMGPIIDKVVAPILEGRHTTEAR